MPKPKPIEEIAQPKDPQEWIPVQSRRKRVGTVVGSVSGGVAAVGSEEVRTVASQTGRREQLAQRGSPSEHG